MEKQMMAEDLILISHENYLSGIEELNGYLEFVNCLLVDDAREMAPEEEDLYLLISALCGANLAINQQLDFLAFDIATSEKAESGDYIVNSAQVMQMALYAEATGRSFQDLKKFNIHIMEVN